MKIDSERQREDNFIFKHSELHNSNIFFVLHAIFFNSFEFPRCFLVCV